MQNEFAGDLIINFKPYPALDLNQKLSGEYIMKKQPYWLD